MALFLLATRFGKAIRAVADNPDLAACVRHRRGPGDPGRLGARGRRWPDFGGVLLGLSPRCGELPCRIPPPAAHVRRGDPRRARHASAPWSAASSSVCSSEFPTLGVRRRAEDRRCARRADRPPAGPPARDPRPANGSDEDPARPLSWGRIFVDAARGVRSALHAVVLRARRHRAERALRLHRPAQLRPVRLHARSAPTASASRSTT